MIARMTFLITHGYMEHGKKGWLQQMKNELLNHGDYNVIIVVSNKYIRFNILTNITVGTHYAYFLSLGINAFVLGKCMQTCISNSAQRVL